MSLDLTDITDDSSTSSHSGDQSMATYDIVELNVGGRFYTTSISTLEKYPQSMLADVCKIGNGSLRDSNSRYFIDRDGDLFTHVLDYVRSGLLTLPDDFNEYVRLIEEAEYYNIPELSDKVRNRWKQTMQKPGQNWKPGNYITLTEHNMFTIRHHDRIEGVHHKRTVRIIVAGHVQTCANVFRESLCTDRDTNTEKNRYTSRLYLTHTSLEKAFLELHKCGYELISNACTDAATRNKMVKAETDMEKWLHVLTHVFCRREISTTNRNDSLSHQVAKIELHD